MSSPACQKILSPFLWSIAAFVAAISFGLSTPAFATDGRTAVGMCIDSTASGARCAWSVNDQGEIDICNKNGCVYCPSATDECTVVSKTRPRPTRGLPPGARVETPLGTFEVSSQPPKEPLFGVPLPRKTETSKQ